MKTILTLLILVFALLKISNNDTFGKFNGIYLGVEDTEGFKFTDSNKQAFYFYKIEGESEFNLFDKNLIGQKFTITWVLKMVEIKNEVDDVVYFEEVKVIIDLDKL